MKTNGRTSSRGFTLIESMLMICVSMVIMALCVPAVLEARQQERRQSCKNNLKYLALALHNYHDVFNRFPPAWCADHFDASSQAWYGWQSFLLPYLEEVNLYNQIDFREADWIRDEKAGARGTRSTQSLARIAVRAYRCPEDSTADQNPFRDGYATSNYSGNFGTELLPRWYESGTEQFWPGGADTPQKSNGIFVVNGSNGFRDITDGTSNTLMIGERSAFSGAGLWVGVRSNRHENDVMTDLNHLSGLNKSFAGFSGRHEGGVNFALCDGSVRMLNPSIASSAEGGVLQHLATRAGGEVIGEF